jgi:hypothetical protein
MLSVIMLNVVMLNVIMLNVVMLKVIILNVVMLNVVVPSVVAPSRSAISDKEKGSIWNDTCGQCCKTFYGRKLRLFIIRKSICPWQAFPA